MNRTTVATGLAILFASACSADEDAGAALPVVAVPLAPLAGLVDALAPAGAVKIVVLLPPGASPSTYQPALDDLRETSGALLYLEVGHPAFVFERTWLPGLLEDSRARRVRLFDDCPLTREDYHVWVSSTCLGAGAVVTAEALRSVLPTRTAEIDAALERFEQRLEAVDSASAELLSPYRGRSFLVLHPAWGYLAREHGLVQLEILSHGTGDPGPARLAELIDQSRRAGVRVVYVQPQFNQAPARLVAQELGAELVSLDPLERDPVAVIDGAVHKLADGFALEAHE